MIDFSKLDFSVWLFKRFCINGPHNAQTDIAPPCILFFEPCWIIFIEVERINWQIFVGLIWPLKYYNPTMFLYLQRHEVLCSSIVRQAVCGIKFVCH